MRRVTHSGSTVEEAIAAALKELGVPKEEAEIRILSEGRKGFFGFGAKPAEVEVTAAEPADEPEPEAAEPDSLPDPESEPAEESVPEQPEETETAETEHPADQAAAEAEAYLRRIAEEMGVTDLKIRTERKGKQVTMYLESKKAAVLIGKRGQTLNALQQLTHLAANKFSGQFLTVRLDAENYRERRQEALELLAMRMADKAVRTGEKVLLEPMPSHERKVIHHALSTRLDVETHSEGKEPKRYLVIEPLK